jgi:cytidyltransferase-like protein
MKKYFTTEDIDNYKNYKYKSEDNTFLTQQYYKIWVQLQKCIPSFIHPNIITILGLLSIITGFVLMKNYNCNKIMGLSILLYMGWDSIDGIHARKIKNTSIIGEYFDHLIDMVNTGMITDCLLTQLGIEDLFVKNFTITITSFCFIVPHYKSIITKIIVFEGTFNVSLILTISSLILLLGIRLPKILTNLYFIIGLLIIILLAHVYKMLQIMFNLDLSNSNSNSNTNTNIQTPIIIFLWYIIKIFVLTIKENYYPFSNTIIDALLLLELTNYKIFKKDINWFILIIPILYIINPLIISSIIINYIVNIVNKISKELEINMFKVEEKKLRVFCCGVFDMCHLGHMILFKKISESFDEPIKLIVGVHSDDVCRGYKREPIINELIRLRTIELCKYVDEIIEDCPLIITKEYILKNNFDVIIIGEEYKDNNDIKWYPGSFELNNYKYISRCTDISTTDIIKKIKSL